MEIAARFPHSHSLDDDGMNEHPPKPAV